MPADTIACSVQADAAERAPDPLDPPSEFIVTKEYRRFAEFCEACRRYRYIGLCYGPPGVGKTLSARHFANWDQLEPRLPSWAPYLPLPAEISHCRTVFYTPEVVNAPRKVAEELRATFTMFDRFVWEASRSADEPMQIGPPPQYCRLLIVDEADRLRMESLEQLRDLYDRRNAPCRSARSGRAAAATSSEEGMGLVLIGMPGLEKRLARYPQLYSRVGFAHEYRPLSAEEMRFLLRHKWQQLGLRLREEDFTDAEAVAAVIRITGGNFRLVQRLFAQIERILAVNELSMVTSEAVEAARECLVIGPV